MSLKLNFISTYALNNSLRASTLEKQAALNKAQVEVTTGKYADIGLELGGFSSTTISLEKQILLIDQITVTNAVVGNGMSTMQQAISNTIDQANDFIGQVTTELSGKLDPDLLSILGNTMLDVAESSFNASFKGEFLFSGLNTDSKALVDYDGADGAAAKAAVQNAFFATFGFNASDPMAQTLTATDIENFVNGAFDTLFDDANWEALWSGSSDRGRRLKISGNEFAENATTAYNPAFRTVASAAVLIAEFGDANLNEQALDQLANMSVTRMHKGVSEMGQEQSILGVVEGRISAANDRMEFQKNILTTQMSDLTDVDPYEAAVNLNQITTSLEASYAATARIQSLSLLNFI